MDSSKIIKVTEATIPKTRLLYIGNVLFSLLYLITYGITWNSLLIVLSIFFIMNCLGVTITYHRYWSHKSFTFKHKWLEKLCTLFALLSGSGSAIGWANIHRQHHKHSDKQEDPHQAEKGFFKIMLMDYKLEVGHKYIVDLLRNKFLVKTHQYYFAILLLYCLVLYYLWGIQGLAIGFCIPSGVTMLSENLTNFINHYKENKYGPSNVWWMNIFSFGDGWHKNHHDNPGNYTTTNKWYELDISGLCIKYILRKV